MHASYLLTEIINVSCWRMQMRGFTLLTATILTFGYGFAAQAAMKVDRAATIRRVAATVEPTTPTADANRVWYGGMLAPITGEAKAAPRGPETGPAPERGKGRDATPAAPPRTTPPGACAAAAD